MSQTLVAQNAFQNFACGSGRTYSADATGLVSNVQDADVVDMLRMGCEFQTGSGDLGPKAVTQAKIADHAVGGLQVATGMFKHALVAGAAAGNVTVAGIATTDELLEVLHIIGTGSAVTDVTDLTSEFTISATNTINS